jgi:hypothetical protein
MHADACKLTDAKWRSLVEASFRRRRFWCYRYNDTLVTKPVDEETTLKQDRISLLNGYIF